MARKTIFAPDEYYHIYNRGTDKRKVFLNKKDYERFIALLYLTNSLNSVHLSNYQGLTLMELLALPREKTLVDIGAYCLMGNHFHLLIRACSDTGTSVFMQKLTTAYTMYFNKKNARTGSLFEGSFRAAIVDEDEYLKYLFSYIHLNPVKFIEPKWKKEGIREIKRAENFLATYKYSSYRHYCGEDCYESVILNPTSFPEYFQTGREFKDFINDWLDYQDEYQGLTLLK